MVFLVRETLTEEDQNACRRAAEHWCKSFRKPAEGRYSRMFACFYLTALCGFGLKIIANNGGIRNLATAFVLICLAGVWVFLWPWPPRAPVFFKPVLAAELQNIPLRVVFFGDGSFSIWTPAERIRLSCQAITSAWEDQERFYLFFKDRPPLVLRKSGFARWMPEDFRDFLERELEASIERI